MALSLKGGLIIRTLNNKEFKFDFPETSTVDELKQRIQNTHGIRAD